MTRPAADTDVRLPAPKVTFCAGRNGPLYVLESARMVEMLAGIWLGSLKPTTMLPSGAHSVPFWMKVCASTRIQPPAESGATGTPFWAIVMELAEAMVLPVDMRRKVVLVTG